MITIQCYPLILTALSSLRFSSAGKQLHWLPVKSKEGKKKNLTIVCFLKNQGHYTFCFLFFFFRNVVKAFYTAGFLFDILTTFGELTEEITNHRKYARWKAAYIHRCLKNGEQPIPGPLKGDDEGFEEDAGAVGGMGGPSPSNGPEGEASGSDDPFVPSFPQMGGAHAPGFVLPPAQPAGGATGGPRLSYGDGQPGLVSLPVPTPGSQAPPSTPSGSAQPSPSMTPLDLPRAANGVSLQPDDFHKAQKYCKYAGSALQYEDVPTAIDNLQKALRLLTTGSEGL